MSFAQVLTLAEQMEIIGQETYRRFAEQANDPAIREVFVYLADEEVKHEEFFRDLRQRLQSGEAAGQGLSAEQLAELEQIVASARDSNVTDALEDTAASVSADDLLGRAITLEKAVVALFNKTRIFLGDALGEKALDAIIAEELEHIRTLEAKLSS